MDTKYINTKECTGPNTKRRSPAPSPPSPEFSSLTSKSHCLVQRYSRPLHNPGLCRGGRLLRPRPFSFVLSRSGLDIDALGTNHKLLRVHCFFSASCNIACQQQQQQYGQQYYCRKEQPWRVSATRCKPARQQCKRQWWRSQSYGVELCKE